MPSAELTYQGLSPQPHRLAGDSYIEAAASSPSSWLRTLGAATRRWFAIPLILGLLGGLAGVAAGMAAKPSAEILLRAQSTAVDGAGITTNVNSVVVELDTAALYEEAASSTGGSPAELRDRTRISAIPESQIISISVTSTSPEQAVEEVDALAKAALGANEARVEEELAKVTRQTRDLISGRKLIDPDAERARLTRLGDSLGANQSSLTVGARQLLLIQSGQNSRMLPSPALLGAMGLVGGVLLGLAGALLLGTRRGRIGSARKLKELYPQVSIIEDRDLDTVIELEAPSTSTVFVGGVGRQADQLDDVVGIVHRRLTALGHEAHIVDSLRLASTEATEGQVSVVPIELNTIMLRRIGRAERALLVVAVDPVKTRVQKLDSIAANLPERSYLLAGPRSAEWH